MARRKDKALALHGLRALLATVAVLAIVPVWWLAPQRWLTMLGWRLLLAGFRLRVSVVGEPCSGRRVLYVANHVSWVDIAALGKVLNAGFVAKSQVARWPLIGRLAQRYGCAFITRERRATAAFQAAAMSDRLRAGRALVLFPEGTTGPGDRILPFRSSLFAAVAELEDCLVQPVTVTYRRRDGSALCAEGLRRVAWLDDDALVTHALELAASGGAHCELVFGEPIAFLDRKSLASRCETVIRERLSAHHAATLNRAA